ncbi:MAG: hypothetical protein LBH37_05000, partial [Oscillospiraceae bacterium]|jgi:hypothetical protein|nr:hypothetical protein [Oscillospiraceae bacterium]
LGLNVKIYQKNKKEVDLRRNFEEDEESAFNLRRDALRRRAVAPSGGFALDERADLVDDKNPYESELADEGDKNVEDFDLESLLEDTRS